MDFSKEITFGKNKKADPAPAAEVRSTDVHEIESPVIPLVDPMENRSKAQKKASAKKKKEAYPSKTRINLIQKQKKRFSTATEILLFILLVVLIAVFAKVAVIDPLAKAAASSQEVAQLQAQLDELKAANEGKEELDEEYSKYIVDGLTDEERALMNREGIIDLLRSKVMNFGYMSSLKVSGNVVTVTCVGVSLNDVSSLVLELEKDDRVSYVTVATAQGVDEQGTSATISITMKGADELALEEEEGATNG